MNAMGRGDPMDNRKPSFFVRFFVVLLVTALLLGLAAYGALYVLLKGPSDYAGGLFAAGVEDVPLGNTVLHLFLSDEEIDRYQKADENSGEEAERMYSVYP